MAPRSRFVDPDGGFSTPITVAKSCQDRLSALLACQLEAPGQSQKRNAGMPRLGVAEPEQA